MSKSKNKGIVSTEMELVLEQTQQGSRHGPSDAMHNPPKPLKIVTHWFTLTVLSALRRPDNECDESNIYVLERVNTASWNPVKEILLKLNLPDHRSILMDSKIHIKMEMEVPGSSKLIDL
ncbi:hypothetical protein Tco_0632285 [Tanacetum coccineum]